MRIVVPLDGSEFAEAALAWAKALSERISSEIVLCSVIEVPTDFAAWITAAGTQPHSDYTRVVDQRRRYLHDAAARYGLEHFSIDLRVGTPAREILACASSTSGEVSLIMLSTHGLGGFERLALGSVALQVIHGHAGPVMTIREQAAVRPPGFERLLVPIDGSLFSKLAVDRAMALVGPPFPHAHLVRVFGTPRWAQNSINRALVVEYLEASGQAAEEQLRELGGRLRADGYETTTELRDGGEVVDEIVAAAETSNADFIAMTTHGLGGLGRVVLGSVADGVVRTSTRPVLLFRASQEP